MQKAGSKSEPTEEDDLEEKKKKDENWGLPGDPTWPLKDRQKVFERMNDAGTPLGLRDPVFDADAMVADSFVVAMSKVHALKDMMDSVIQASRKMHDEDWARFQEIPCLRMHNDEQVMHGTIFAAKEPSWKAVLQKPKKTKQTCVFLHMGTEPPTQYLTDFLTKLGWYGVSIGSVPPPPGNEDSLQFTKIDPGNWSDQAKVDALISPGGGLVPRPKEFGLAYVNVTFNPRSDADFIDPYDENFEEKLRLRNQRAEMAEKERQFGQRDEEGRPLFADSHMPEPPPSTATGHGKVGISRGERVRRRLRALRNSLRVALHRLQREGSLVVFWPGLPLHPVLFFLAASLRKVFQRVHVLSSPGSKTFDIYILAVGFKRDKAEDQTPGMGGRELKSFFGSAWRSETLDDVLLWTLPQAEEEEELSIGASGRGIVSSYADLWTTFSEKFRALAMDLGVVVLGDSNAQGSKMPKAVNFDAGKGKAKTKAKAKAKAATKEKKDEQEESTNNAENMNGKGSSDAAGNASIAPEQGGKQDQSTDVSPTKAEDTVQSASTEAKTPKDDLARASFKVTGQKASQETKDTKALSEEAPPKKNGETSKKDEATVTKAGDTNVTSEQQEPDNTAKKWRERSS